MTTAEVWLDDIIEHRDDDAPRLIFADWLEEHGDDARAEFIRVQVALARYPPAPTGLSDGFAAGRWRQRRDALRRREWELLEAHPREWFWLPGLGHPGFGEGQPLCWWGEGDSRGARRIAEGAPRRGFVAEITLTLADWCGGPCGRCGGDGQAHGSDRPFEWSPDPDARKCPACCGSGRTPGHGPALVRAAPIEVVTLSDKRPWDILAPPGDDPKSWWIEGDDDGLSRGQHCLPGPLWDHLTGEPGTWGTCPIKVYRGEDYSSADDAAVADLSRALLAWAWVNPPPA